MPRDVDVDVLVSGYGPTGATLAALLGRRGWRVQVIDRAAGIYDKPRAITADHEALRIFQEVGVADEVLAASAPHPGTDYLGLQGQVIKRFYPGPPPHALGWIPSFMFVQPELEATLRHAVQQLPTVDAQVSHELIGHAQDGDGVSARVRCLADGTVREVRARYLVAADGASSEIRRQVMPQVEDLAFDEWWVVVDAWIERPVELPERCVQYCWPTRPGTFIVGPGRLRRWEIKILPHESPEAFQDPAHVWRVLRSFVDTDALSLCRSAVYRFHALVVQSWRHGRIFLAGDAAHQMPPFLGQGLCAGLRDAYNLAWKLDAVMRAQAADALLDTYTPERKRHVRTVVGHAKSFGLIIGELDEAAAAERDRRLVEELESGRAVTIRQRFIPGLEAGLIAGDAAGQPLPGAGELLVQPWVRRPGAAWQRMDDVLGARWAILAGCGQDLEGLDDAGLAPWRAVGGVVAVVTPSAAPSDGDISASVTADLCLQEQDTLLSAWLQAHQAVALIARPDRYVYSVAGTAAALRAQLQQVCTTLAGSAAR